MLLQTLLAVTLGLAAGINAAAINPPNVLDIVAINPLPVIHIDVVKATISW